MINFVLNNIFSISIMNTVLRGSLIQRPKRIPHPTLMPRKERMWHAEHFGVVTLQDKANAVKKTGKAAEVAANSEEAKVTGEIAKDSGKEILRIVKEGVKILMSSTAGIAIFSGIILAMEKTLSPEQLFKTTRIIFIVTLGISFGGAIVTYLMNIGKQTSQTKEFQEAEEVINDSDEKAEAEAAVQAALAEDVVEDTSVEDVTEEVSTTTEDIVS
tara:strand:+ start:1737 stop:2381 length:645 start_codon:yes stop_codon:yes gene_type:complete